MNKLFTPEDEKSYFFSKACFSKCVFMEKIAGKPHKKIRIPVPFI